MCVTVFITGATFSNFMELHALAQATYILVYDHSPILHFVPLHTVLLQNSADPSIRNTDGKTAQDLAEPSAKLVLTGGYKKEELLEAAR